MEHIICKIEPDVIARGVCDIANESISINELDSALLKQGKEKLLMSLAPFVLENKEYKIRIKRISLTAKEWEYVEFIIKNICCHKKSKIEKCMAVLKDWKPYNLECDIE
jgi:hypothetical protein